MYPFFISHVIDEDADEKQYSLLAFVSFFFNLLCTRLNVIQVQINSETNLKKLAFP